MAKEKVVVNRQASSEFYPDEGNLIKITKSLVEDTEWNDEKEDYETKTVALYTLSTSASVLISGDEDGYGAEYGDRKVNLMFSEKKADHLIDILKTLKKEILV